MIVLLISFSLSVEQFLTLAIVFYFEKPLIHLMNFEVIAILRI